MATPREGNKFLLLYAGILLSLISIGASWGTVRMGNVGGFPSGMLDGMNVAVHGLNGKASLGIVSIPFWLLALTVNVALFLIVLNKFKAIAVPRGVILGLLVVCGLLTVYSIIALMGGGGSLGMGGFLLLAAVGIGLMRIGDVAIES